MMKKALSLAATICIWAGLIGIVGGGIYGLTKLGKTISYNWWYEDQVRQTVREMVNESALK